MAKLTIDSREANVPEGNTLLAACRAVGIDVPTLCHRDGCEAFASCMVCVVKDTASGKLVPSCCVSATEGMVIESESDEVRDARRTAIELLLSEHVGDCEGPCRRTCPAHMDIPQMIRQIAAGDMAGAIRTVKADIALPAVLGRICPAPCERGCRRGESDSPVAIMLLKRYAADADLASGDPWRPPREASTSKAIAIVGAGPAGLAAAYYLLQQGHDCTLFDDREKPGGMLRYGVSEDVLGRDVLDAEIEGIAVLGAGFEMNRKVGRDVSMGGLRSSFDAVAVTAGELTGEAAGAFGVELSARGIRVDGRTFQTSERCVFAGGSAVFPSRMAIRAVADGKSIAASVHQFVTEGEVLPGKKRFDSRTGKLLEGEIAEFMKGAEASGRVTPAGGAGAGFTELEAAREAARCLECDCRKGESCRLRKHAERYEARQSRYRGVERRRVEIVRQHSDVVYEPGKCIRCGLCVQISEKAGEALGLTFIGRGFDVRVGVPFDESLAAGLAKAGAECVAACPTGALALRSSEVR